jgi:hypothetical protein
MRVSRPRIGSSSLRVGAVLRWHRAVALRLLWEGVAAGYEELWLWRCGAWWRARRGEALQRGMTWDGVDRNLTSDDLDGALASRGGWRYNSNWHEVRWRPAMAWSSARLGLLQWQWHG